ncbi:MAG: helix-turn-helix domain-containing protein [Clostridia bacterium]|nr:helix-turn-helix domain-containing protein [Clostridia bacterium]
MKFRIFKTAAGTNCYPLHEHGHYELILYIKGIGQLRTEIGNIPFSPGTIAIVPPGVKHGSCSKDEFCNICIEGDWDQYFCFKHIAIGKDNERAECARLFELICENRNTEGTYLDSLCIALANFVMKQLENDSDTGRAVKKIADEIMCSALDAHLNVSSILEASGYSKDYIRACFRREMGKTPIEFLTEIRMRHACHLIDIYKNTLALSEIAERCGCLDYIYFSKKFKEYIGVSPRCYRDS